MLSVKEKGIMLCIIEHCKRIESKIKGISKVTFFDNDDIKEIVCFNVLQIGEIAKVLPSEFLLKHNKVPWKDIKGMRDWVAHGYGTIDFEIVWQTASRDIKPLRNYCEMIIEENR